MRRFDAMCGWMMFLCIIAGFALGGRKDGFNGTLLVGGLVGIMAVWLLVRVMLIFFHLGRCVTRDVAYLAKGGSLRTLPQRGVVQPQRLRPSPDFIERLCHESGWVLASREADLYRVRPGDHRAVQYVEIRYSERFSNVLFQSWFPIRFSLQPPTTGLSERLLMRNVNLNWSSWTMAIGQSCEACLFVTARVPTGALDANLFDRVCGELVGELRAFHLELHDKFKYSLGQVVTDGPCPPVQQQARASVPQRWGDNVPGVWYVN